SPLSRMDMKLALLLSTLVTGVMIGGCAVHDPLFCDDTHPCKVPGRTYCDTTGDYEEHHIRNTCIASPFDAMPPPDSAPKRASLAIDRATQDFHEILVASKSDLVAMVVQNDGDLPSSPIAISVMGANATAFVVVPLTDGTDCAGQRLAAGKSC